eukprot:COSAG06_NODE_2962_length_6022_cov_28.844816_6_plen_151_part_00
MRGCGKRLPIETFRYKLNDHLPRQTRDQTYVGKIALRKRGIVVFCRAFPDIPQDISVGGDGSAYESLKLEPASPQQPAEGAGGGGGGARAKSPVQRLDLQGQSAAAPAVMGADVTAAVVEKAQAGEMGSRLRKAGAKVSEKKQSFCAIYI